METLQNMTDIFRPHAQIFPQKHFNSVRIYVPKTSIVKVSILVWIPLGVVVITTGIIATGRPESVLYSLLILASKTRLEKGVWIAMTSILEMARPMLIFM